MGPIRQLLDLQRHCNVTSSDEVQQNERYAKNVMRHNLRQLSFL